MTTSNVPKRERILIVEDSLGVARALNRTLSLPQGGGHWVETCDSGEAALERLRGAHFGLLVSDLRLPGMNGLALLEHARQISPETRSVLITAFGSPQVEERARHLANAYLPKPFHLQDLIRIVQRVLSEPVAHKQPFLEGEAKRYRAMDMSKLSRRKAMHLRILACDLDGTLAENGQIAAETWGMLRHVRSDAAGIAIIFVTSHTLDSYVAGGPYADLCEAIVAENGAVVYFPRRDTVTLPFGSLSSAVLRRLNCLDVPLEQGQAIAATHVPHDEAILEALREAGGGAVVEYNQGAVMVLPPGATKGTGLRYALRELGYSPRNVVAYGDAENDRSLFEMVEFAVTASSAPPDVQSLADVVLPQVDGTSMQVLQILMADLLAGCVPDYQPRPNRRILLGHRTSEASVYLDSFVLMNSSLGIFGASGDDEHWDKSWLAGLLAEELLRQGYQVCVIDPKGDYRALGASPHSLLLGGPETWLPSVADVADFCESGRVSLVLDLSVYTVAERAAYVLDLLSALRDLRARLGRPHWFLIDEIESFCPPEGGPLTDLLVDLLSEGGFGLVGDRPSQVALILLEALDCWLVTHLSLPEEIETLSPFLTKYAGGPAALSQLPSLPVGQAYLCLGDAGQSSLATRGFVKLRILSQ
ncbi:MAG: HAD hydrolase family protein [Chloroflexota bacterium]|nr:HAD hydrolase family protein [Chloroflexota bacterium]